ncbi:MAG: dTMP kinase [Chloroflexota bacterium]
MFITFEGTEGSGKTTQIKEVYRQLTAQGYGMTLTREPGGTDISNQIRTILLENHENKHMQARAELLLFCASRAQLVGEVIQPTIDKGGIILCDRYADSTLAYQGYGHGLPVDDLKQILQFATHGIYPDVTVYLDLSPEKGLERRRKGQLFGEDWNRLDDMELAFHQRVYDGYQAIIADDPERFIRINADQSLEAVTADILSRLDPLFVASKA